MTHAAARAESISKRFGATVALDNVDFDVAFGEIHAVVGENGAGKSTLIRILGGVYRPDSGNVTVDGKPCHFASPHDAIAAGIVTIPQELRLVPALSVAENITLGDPPVRGFGPFAIVDRARMRAEARAVLAQLDFDPDPRWPVARLSFAERQLVAIAKALRRRCRVFVLDEPTAALEKREIDRLFAVLARMKAQGTAIVYISHRLDEVVSLADRCTVMRDGKVTAVSRRGEFAVGRSDLGDDRTRRRKRRRGVVTARRSSARRRGVERRGDAPPACAADRGSRRAPRQRHGPDHAAPVRRRRAGHRDGPRPRASGQQVRPTPSSSASAWCRASAASAS